MRDHLGRHYDKTSDFQQAQFETLSQLVRRTLPDVRAIRTLLDLGSGTGSRTRQCLDLFPDLDNITAIEPDRDMIEVAVESYADPRIDYRQGVAADLGKLIGSQAFDGVILNWSAHWIPQKETLLRDLSGHTRQGSWLMLSTCEELPQLLQHIDGYIRNDYQITAGESPFHYLDKANWHDLLTRHGWTIAAVRAVNIIHEVEDAAKYLDHWFTASAAKFLYGSHIQQLSPDSRTDLITYMKRLFPSSQHPDGLHFTEKALFILATRNPPDA